MPASFPQIILGRVRWLLVWLFTSTYNYSLKTYTIDPIAEIAECQDDTDKLKVLLPHFRERKEQELCFVKTAVRSSKPAQRYLAKSSGIGIGTETSKPSAKD